MVLAGASATDGDDKRRKGVEFFGIFAVSFLAHGQKHKRKKFVPAVFDKNQIL